MAIHAASPYHVPQIQVLFLFPAEVLVEVVDGLEFEALGFVASGEPDGAFLLEEMLGIGNGLAKILSMSCEDPHAIGKVFRGL